MIDLSNENVWLVSDTHFNHKKLCMNEEVHFDRTRNYKYVEEMNTDIIAKWNESIKDDDIVIFMGDFLMGTPIYKLEDEFNKYYNALNKGKKMYWIAGNHDTLIMKLLGIEMVYDMMFMKDNDLYVLQHRDFTEDQHRMPYCEYDKHVKFVHGHTHFPDKISTFNYNDMTLVQNNVCWDAWYRPVNVNELKNCIEG